MNIPTLIYIGVIASLVVLEILDIIKCVKAKRMIKKAISDCNKALEEKEGK